MFNKKALLFLFLLIHSFISYSQKDVYYQQGVRYLEQGNYLEAVEDFNEVIRLDDQFPEGYFQRGLAYYYLENYTKAQEDFTIFLQARPDNAEAFFWRSKTYLAQSKIREAINDIRQAIIWKPSSAYVIQSAEVYLANKDYENALKEASRIIANDAHYLRARLITAIASFELKYFDQAKNIFNECFEGYTPSKIVASKIVADYSGNRELLLLAEKWMMDILPDYDTYEANHLYAIILHKLERPIRAFEVANKAISLAKKERKSFSPTLRLIEQLDKSLVDDLPPSVVLLSPVRGKDTLLVDRAQPRVSIIGKASDPNGIKEVLINGKPAQLFENGDFQASLTFFNHEKQCLVESSDLLGNRTVRQFPIKWKENKPLAKKTTKYASLGKTYVLVFSNSQYEYWNNLANPLHDAKTICNDLRNTYTMETDLVIDATQNQMLLKIKEYLQRKFEDNDQLLIFFAGHGQFDETFKEGYVVAKDSRLDDAAKTSYLAHSTLRTYINNIPCKHILLVMDVCFGGAFDPTLANKDLRGPNINNADEGNPEEFIRRKLEHRTRKYITSGGKEYVSDGSPGSHSPFARQFLEALRSQGGKDNILTLAELLTFLEKANPPAQSGEFGANEPGSDFLMVVK